MKGLYVAALLLASLAAAIPPMAVAGTAEDPELTDPSGDQVVTRTLPALPSVSDDAFHDIDIRAAWFSATAGPDTIEGPTTNVTLTIRFGAAWQNAGTLRISLKAEAGPTSVFGSTSDTRIFNDTIQGTTPRGNISAITRTGNDLSLSYLADPFGAFRVFGGDVLTIASLAANRTNPGALAVTQDDQSGADSAAGTRSFTVPRPPPVASASLEATGGVVQSKTPQNFTGAQATVNDPDVLVQFRLRLTNTGTDPDNFTFHHTMAFLSDVGSGDAFAQRSVLLNPQDSVTHDVSLRLRADTKTRVANGEIFASAVTVTSELGANATLTLRIILELPAQPLPGAPREVKPAGLTFLTPAAEALGFDAVFFDFAEAAFLALLVLLAILAVFFALYLGPNLPYGEPAVEAPPATARGGAQAGRTTTAKPGTAAAAAATLGTAGRSAAGAAAEQDDGKAPPLALESVTHSPAKPKAGDDVQTTVILRAGSKSAQVRVVLSVGEADVAEDQLVVPARTSKTVRLKWTAGPGDNKIRVRVFPL